jgi:hypothetical protein
LCVSIIKTIKRFVVQFPSSGKRNYQTTDIFMIYLIVTKNPSENQMSSY